jgi:hypothetical protein
VLPDRAVSEKFEAFSDNFAKGREIERINDRGASGDLPGGKKDNDSNNTYPVRYKIPKTPPPTVGDRGVYFTNGDKIQWRILLPLGRNGLLTLCGSESMRPRPWLSSCALGDLNGKFQISDLKNLSQI